MPKISAARKAEVRDQLIEAAVEVLLTHGPSGFTSRRVLHQAGLSAGALYHYFASLDELYEAVARRFSTMAEPLLAGRVDPASDPAAEAPPVALIDIHVAVMDDLFAHGDQVLLSRLRSAADANGGVRRALQEYDRRTVDQAGELNVATQKAGLFRSDADAEALVEVIGSFFEGFNTKSRATGFATSRERVLRLFLQMLCDRLIDPTHPDAITFRTRLEEISQP